MKTALLLISLVFSMFIVSCRHTFDPSQAKSEILELHNAQRDFHFNKQALLFADQMSDNLIMVNRGQINKPSKEANIQRWTDYFEAVEFIKWEDKSAPIIRFSEDGSLAYTIVDKLVILRYEDTTSALITDTTHFAWTSIYRKTGQSWKIENVTSTNQ